MSDDVTPTNGGTNGHAISSDPEARALFAEMKALEASVLLARSTWARQHGITFNGARREYDILGYDDLITNQQYRDEYERGGIAGRVIDVMPDATWRGDPPVELIEDEDPQKETEFELAWTQLEKKHQINAKFCRVDKLSRLSTYAVLLIGASGDLAAPLPKGNPDKLLYLMPFLGGGGPGGSSNSRTAAMGADATIFEYETNATSPRFGLPISYQLKRTDIASPQLNRPVHWTRIVHIAEGLLDDEVFGQPSLQRIWNLLIDLRKVTGGGAEAFWLRANQGMHIDIDKDMALPDVSGTVEALKVQAEEYKHQLTRWLRTRGVKVQTLGSDVANFEAPADAILTQIAGAKGIPKRILTGSEMGELASSQDRENFRDIVIGRQLQYAGPYIVRQLADRLIEFGYLPTPKEGPDEYIVQWPHIQVLTEQEKVSGAQGWAAVNASYGDVVFTDAEIRDKWEGYEPLTDEQRAEVDERAAEKVQQAQAAMMPPGEDVDADTLAFNVDEGEAPEDDEDDEDDEEKNPFKAAEDYELHTAKFQESQHPRDDAGKFDEASGGSGDSDSESGRAKGGEEKDKQFGGGDGADAQKKRKAPKLARQAFKQGLVNLHLKLSTEETDALKTAHARAQEAGFTGSQLEFLRQQLEVSAQKDGDPAVLFSKETLARYGTLKDSVLASSKVSAKAEAKYQGFVKSKGTAKAKPAAKEAKGGGGAKAKEEDEKKKGGGGAKEKKDKAPKAHPLDALQEAMKADEKEALQEGYTAARRDGFKGSITDFLEEQLDLYGTAEEGDPRLKTFFYAETLTAYKKFAKARAAQSGVDYKFSSTQVQLPPMMADALLGLGRSIPAFDLCEEEGGLEDDAHITVKYGLHTNNVADVRKCLATYVGPIRFTLGKTAIFEPEGKKYDVLYVEVESADLQTLNQRISNSLETTDTHPTYQPHATIAYLKKGLGVRYVGLTNFEGWTATVGKVRFCPAAGSDIDLRLTGRDETTGTFTLASPRAAEDVDDALVQTLAQAIAEGKLDVVTDFVKQIDD